MEQANFQTRTEADMTESGSTERCMVRAPINTLLIAPTLGIGTKIKSKV